MVEIAKALCLRRPHPDHGRADRRRSPTARSRRLFEIIRELKRRRASAIVYISHRLEEVVRIGDRVTVLRDGRKVGDADAGDADDRRGWSRMMVGRDLAQHCPARPRRPGREVLRVAGLSRGAASSRDVDLRAPRRARSSASPAWSAPAGPSSRAPSSAPTGSTRGRGRRSRRQGRCGSACPPTRSGRDRLRPRGPQAAGPGPATVGRARTSPCRRCASSAAGRPVRQPRARARRGASDWSRRAARSRPPRSSAGPLPERRQPAEGRARQVAGGRRRDPDPRRADARHRRRRQGGHPPAHGRLRARRAARSC